MSVKPKTYNGFVIPQGTDWAQKIAIKAGGVLVDPTGWEIHFQAKVNISSNTYQIDASTLNGKITINSTDKNFTITLPNALTQNLESGSYVYNLDTKASGIITRRLEGTLQITPEV